MRRRVTVLLALDSHAFLMWKYTGSGRSPTGMRYPPVVRSAAACRAASWLAPALWLLLGSPAQATMPPASGPVTPEVSAAFARGLFQVPDRVPGLETSAAPSAWVMPIIRVAFTDSAIVHPKVEIEKQLFDTTGAVPT